MDEQEIRTGWYKHYHKRYGREQRRINISGLLSNAGIHGVARLEIIMEAYKLLDWEEIEP